MFRLFTCKSCSRIHLEIGNTQIHFSSPRHLEKYLKNLDSIDTAYYETVNRRKGLKKVIILPLDVSGNVHLGFTCPEFEELKTAIRNYLSCGGDPSTHCDGSPELQIIQCR
jgi:hypothetical protein